MKTEPNQALQTISSSVTVAAEPLCVPPHEMSDLKRWAKEMKPVLRVRIKMKPESDGGRHGPFNEGYYPHFVAAGKSEWLGVRAVRCPDFIYPGEEKEVDFELMYFPEVDYRDLSATSSFSIYEGYKNIGEGIVLENSK